MAVPSFEDFMLPVLQLAGDNQIHDLHTTVQKMAQHFHLSEEDKNELLPSGKQTRFANRVSWAVTYLKKSKLIQSAGRSKFSITERGKKALQESVTKIDKSFLEQFPEYREFKNRRKSTKNGSIPEISFESQEQTPEELLDTSYQSIHQQLASDLLDLILATSPGFFERLVVDLIIAMGYGGSRQDAGKAVGRSGDGGIDGIIKQDRLGLENIYIQAKRWNDTVGRPTVQGFAGSLMGRGASKGILITTSKFSKEAIEYVNTIKQPKIILIDGEYLSDLMIDYNLGVAVVNQYTIKKIDSDYFEE